MFYVKALGFRAMHRACVTYTCVSPHMIYVTLIAWLTIPVPARSEACVCGRSPAEIVGSNLTGVEAWMSFCCKCCVLSARSLCDEPITRPEESYRLWCVVVSDLEVSWMRRPWPVGGPSRQKKRKKMAWRNEQQADVTSFLSTRIATQSLI